MGIIGVVYDTLADFGSHTTIGGLCNAGLTSSRPRQAYWLIIFTVLSGFTVQSLIEVISQFLEYGVTTSTDLSYSNTLMFPAITACNQNRIHCIHLFDRISEVENETKSMNSSATAEEMKQLSTRLSQLQHIFNATGCKNQVCHSLTSELLPIRNPNDTSRDGFAVKIGLIKCLVKPPIKNQVCYYLMSINNTANSTSNPTSSDVNQSWNSFQCSTLLACSYHVLAPGCPIPTTTTTVAPPVGPGSGGGISGQLGRRKRQLPPAGGGGGGMGGMGGGPTPPPVSTDFQSEAKFLQKYMKLRIEDRTAIGHQLLDQISPTFGTIYGFLLSCTYKGRDCSDSTYWFTYSTSKFGNCFSFNSFDNVNDSNVPRQASLTGRDYGVKIELHLDQENYMLEKLSKNAGAKVVIHDPTLPPLPDEYGIDMQPNTASSVAVTTSNISRQAYPYTPNCISNWNQTSLDISTSVNYSLAACQRYVLQRDIANECGCFHPNLIQTSINTSFGVEPCLITPSTNSSSDFYCFGDIIDQYNSGNRTADDCHVVCLEYQYKADVSTSTWPSDQYWILLGQTIPQYMDELSNPGSADQVTIKEKIQNNYAMAEIFFQTLNVINISQSPTMDFWGLISALGGSLGLFTGIAIIMLFEILELGYDLFINIWHYLTGPENSKKKKRKSENDVTKFEIDNQL